MPRLRVISFAAGWLLLTVPGRAQEGTLPSIFSEGGPQRGSVVKKLEPPAIVRPRLPISDHLRAALTESVTARVPEAPAALRPPAKRTWDESGDAVQMERMVVNAKREKKVEVENVPGYLAKAFVTGELLHFKQRGLIPESVNWGLSAVEATGYGGQGDAVRFELSARWRW